MVRQLASGSDQVIVIDSLTYAGNQDSISMVADRIEFEKIDIRDKNAIKGFFADTKIDSVVNFAAETHVDNSITSPEIFLETNILGTFNLLEAAREHKFRFLQVSTDEVYGSIREGEFNESDKLDPSSPYSASKASAELLLQAYVSTYSVEALGVRCSNNYGYYQNREKLIPAFIERMIHRQKLPVYGTGKNVREWIHVSDSVAGIIKVLHGGKVGEFYNISSHDFRENIEVTRKIIDFFQGDESCIDYVEDRLGHDFRYAIDSSKIRSELDWAPQVEFETGLNETIQWYLNNPTYLQEKTEI
jgi:dTDP-glucose 4,6-dehydratase